MSDGANIRVRFGRNLRRLRKFHGMTQDEMGTALEAGRSSYSGYEQGRHEMSLYQIYILSDRFNVKPGAMIMPDLHDLPDAVFAKLITAHK